MHHTETTETIVTGARASQHQQSAHKQNNRYRPSKKTHKPAPCGDANTALQHTETTETTVTGARASQHQQSAHKHTLAITRRKNHTSQRRQTET